jgi:hypothetical protein
MNGRAIPGAYLSCLYVCDKEMSWPHHTGETHQPDWVVYVRDRNLWEITFRLMNVIPERIIFVSRGITVLVMSGTVHCPRYIFYIRLSGMRFCFCYQCDLWIAWDRWINFRILYVASYPISHSWYSTDAVTRTTAVVRGCRARSNRQAE